MIKNTILTLICGWGCLTGYGATKYVNRATGNDAFDGATTGTAKRTIQAAVAISITGAALADGYQTLKHSVITNPGNLRVVYTVGAGESGGAVLDAFESASGLLLLLR